MRICIYGASANDLDAAYFESAEKLGRLIGEKGHSLVFGGGSGGLMGACARGALAGGAEIIGIAGNTRYDFFSEGRGREISNRIQWFAMRAEDPSFHVSYEQGFLNGNYYPVEKARQMLTYDGDRPILDNAWAIYQESRKHA